MTEELMNLIEVTERYTTGGDKTSAGKIPIFRWSGEYFGFIHSSNLFDATSNYLGWVDNGGYVWSSNGSFLGQVIDNNYILKHTGAVEPSSKVSPILPTSPTPPCPEPPRVGRALPFGWQDALEEL